jgi:hypothetical protein
MLLSLIFGKDSGINKVMMAHLFGYMFFLLSTLVAEHHKISQHLRSTGQEKAL